MSVNTPRILEVAEEQALLADERYKHYRRDLVRCLVEVIAAQGEGLSDRKRRDRVAKIVNALGVKFAAEAREVS